MAQNPFGEGEINIPKFRMPNLQSGVTRWIVLLLIALVMAFSAFYTIDPEETGVILRLGKYIRSTDPGLHAKIPFVEKVIKVPILKSPFGAG